MRTFILAFALLAVTARADNLRGSARNEQRDLQAICTLPGLTLEDYIDLMVAANRTEADARRIWNTCLVNQGELRTDAITAPCYDSGPVRTYTSFSGNWECRSNQECADQGISDRCFYKLNSPRGSSCTKLNWDWKAECGSIPVPIGSGPTISP